MRISKGTVKSVVSRTIVIAALFGGDRGHSISFALCTDNSVALDIDLLELRDTVLQGRLHLDWLCFGGNLTLSLGQLYWIWFQRWQSVVNYALFWEVILIFRLVSLFNHGETSRGSTRTLMELVLFRTCSDKFAHLPMSLDDRDVFCRGLGLELGYSGEEDLLVHWLIYCSVAWIAVFICLNF